MRTNYLKPNEALSELFAGLIVTQSFTLATSVMSGRIDAKNILISVIGANTAWGLIDAILYIMNSVFDRNRSLRFARVIATDPDKRAGLEKISAELDPILVPVTDEQDRGQLYRNIYHALANRDLPRRTGLRKDDVMGAVQIFVAALCGTLPALLPLAVVHEPMLGLRTANILVAAFLFIVGYRWAKLADTNPWIAGFGSMGLGLSLVGLAIALGG